MEVPSKEIDIEECKVDIEECKDQEKSLTEELLKNEAEFGADSPCLLSCLQSIIKVKFELQKWNEVVIVAERTNEILKKDDPDSIAIAILLSLKYNAEWALGKFSAAKKSAALAMHIYEKHNMNDEFRYKNMKDLLPMLSRNIPLIWSEKSQELRLLMPSGDAKPLNSISNPANDQKVNNYIDPKQTAKLADTLANCLLKNVVPKNITNIMIFLKNESQYGFNALVISQLIENVNISKIIQKINHKSRNIHLLAMVILIQGIQYLDWITALSEKQLPKKLWSAIIFSLNQHKRDKNVHEHILEIAALLLLSGDKNLLNAAFSQNNLLTCMKRSISNKKNSGYVFLCIGAILKLGPQRMRQQVVSVLLPCAYDWFAKQPKTSFCEQKMSNKNKFGKDNMSSKTALYNCLSLLSDSVTIPGVKFLENLSEKCERFLAMENIDENLVGSIAEILLRIDKHRDRGVNRFSPNQQQGNYTIHAPGTKQQGEIFPQTCYNCKRIEGNGERFMMCSRCKSVIYCTKECQIAHWRSGHKKICRVSL